MNGNAWNHQTENVWALEINARTQTNSMYLIRVCLFCFVFFSRKRNSLFFKIIMLLLAISSGVLTGVAMEVPPLQEMTHTFTLYFLIPGEYSLLAAAVIDDANEVLRARARTNSSEEPIFCRGPPFHVRVNGTV